MTRIAIDCRPLIGHRSGIGRYLYELLREFANREDAVEFYLYSPADIELPPECIKDGRFRVRTAHFRPTILWLHCVVPIWLIRDKVDVFWGPNYALPLFSIRKRRNVVTIHDGTFSRYPETMHWLTRMHNRRMLPWYSRKADLILTDSYFSKDELAMCLHVDDKVRAVYLAAQRPEDWGEPEPIVVDKPFVLAVGTVEPRKNFESLISAFLQLPIKLRDQYCLVIAGGKGWGKVDLGVRDNPPVTSVHVMVTGRVTDAQLSYLYSRAELVAVPSIYEGFGLPVLEAMSFGKPVVCSYNSSVGEVADTAALFFDPFSIDDMSRKLELVLSDDALLKDLSTRSRLRVSSFNWANTADQTLAYILEGGQIVASRY